MKQILKFLALALEILPAILSLFRSVDRAKSEDKSEDVDGR